MPRSSSNSTLKRISRILLKTVLFIVIFLVLVIILIQLPPVQNFARKQMVVFLEKKLQTDVEVGRMYINFPRRITLEDIYIADRANDTLLAGGTIKVDISLMKLLRNQLEIRNLEIRDITARVKRELPDTTFNFQFIIDAFVSDQQRTDTTSVADTTRMEMALDRITLDNINILYKDIVSGSDMKIRLAHLDSRIDKVDPYNMIFEIPEANVRGLHASVYQVKPLVDPDPIAEDLAEAKQPVDLKFGFGRINLDDIYFDYRNDVSAFYTLLDLHKLTVVPENIDLTNRTINLRELRIDSTATAIRLGRKAEARIVEKEIEQEIKSQAQNEWKFIVGELQINSNDFKFNNDNKPKQPHGIDYAHMDAKNFTLHASNFLFSADTISGKISKGSFSEQSGFVLNHLETDFIYSTQGTRLDNLLLETPNSHLKRSAGISYRSLDALANDVGNMGIEAEFIQSKVKIADIIAFAPQLINQPLFANPNEVWYLDGNVSGTLNDLRLEGVNMTALGNTKLSVSGTISGLPNPDAIGGNLVIQNLTTNKNDLKRLLPGTALPENITLPDYVTLRGTINGNMSNAKGNIAISSNLGQVSYVGSVGNITNPDRLRYNGVVTTRDLQLGTITNNPQVVGNITGRISVNGQGIDPNTMSAKLNGAIQSAEINGYNYKNAVIDGEIAGKQFVVNATINDPNIDLDIDASGNLFGQSPAIRFTARIDSIKTLPLRLTTEPLIYRGNITADFSSADPDNLVGELFATNSILVTKDQRLQLDTISMRAGRNDSGRYLHLVSDIMVAQLQGEYKLTEMGYVIQNSIQPYFSIVPSYSIQPVAPYDFTLKAYVEEKPLIRTLLPDLIQMDSIWIDSRFSSTSGLNASVRAPYIQYGPNHFRDLQLNAATLNNRLNLTATMSEFRSGTSMHIYNTSINASAADNKVDFALNIQDKQSRDKYHIEGILDQPVFGNYGISLQPDSLLLNYDKWTVNQGNRINIDGNNISANNFILSQGNQQLVLNSRSSAADAPLDITFTEFQLSTITGFLKADTALADGRLNGTATLLAYTPEPVFTGDLTISDFSMNRDTIGNVKLTVNNRTANQYAVDADITGRGNDISLTGTYTPGAENNNSFNMVLDIRALQLNTIEGMTMGNLRDASGIATGKLDVSGNFEDPDVVGDLTFRNAKFTVGILGSPFTVDNETIEFRENGIYLDEFTLRDSANNLAVIDGAAYTANFSDYLFNIYITTNNFRALNTTKKDNKLYYGKFVFSSELNVKGSSIQPIVDGNITVEDGTELTIVLPSPEPGIQEREGIVQFVDFEMPMEDSIFNSTADSILRSDITGLDVIANIEITRDASFNIIIDEVNGDFINLKGEALLSAGIDPSGKTTLTGPFEIDQGAYQLSFNFLQRRFDIQKGSKIVWLGDPIAAQLDITAIYEVNVAPLDLVGNLVKNDQKNYYLQKLPFQVILKLNGEMMKPTIAFDIVLPEDRNYNVAGDVELNVRSRLAQLRQESSELNKQVFAILLLNRFIGENPFDASGDAFSAEAFARQSVSKLLTEQLNSIAASLIEGVDITFDVASTDDYTTGNRRTRTDLNVGLSKRLLNDRLTITVGSNFLVEGSHNANQRSTNLAENIGVNYQISRDGRYMLRFFRKNAYEGLVDGYIIETGLGFLISVDYDKFKEVFQSRKIRREQKRLQRNQPTTTNATSTK